MTNKCPDYLIYQTIYYYNKSPTEHKYLPVLWCDGDVEMIWNWCFDINMTDGVMNVPFVCVCCCFVGHQQSESHFGNFKYLYFVSKNSGKYRVGDIWWGNYILLI